MKRGGRKSEMSTPIIIWLGIFMVASISAVWFIQKVQPISSESERVNYDINQVQLAIKFACNTATYTKLYNPRIEEGTFFANSTTICMNMTAVSRCESVPCPLANTGDIIDLEKISDLKIEKANGAIKIT